MSDVATNPANQFAEIDALFAAQDITGVPEISFDEGVDRLAANELDELAAAAILNNFEAARREGDLSKIQQMAMVLGATACLHDHMQDLAGHITSKYMSGTEPDDNSAEAGGWFSRHKKETHGRKKRKKWSWLELKFIEV